MFQTFGTEEVAVGPGRVTYQVEDAGGNDRRVAKGDTIGFLGQSGNATAAHLHFEIRLGGPNGTRIDPYATLVAAGC